MVTQTMLNTSLTETEENGVQTLLTKRLFVARTFFVSKVDLFWKKQHQKIISKTSSTKL